MSLKVISRSSNFFSRIVVNLVCKIRPSLYTAVTWHCLYWQIVDCYIPQQTNAINWPVHVSRVYVSSGSLELWTRHHTGHRRTALRHAPSACVWVVCIGKNCLLHEGWGTRCYILNLLIVFRKWKTILPPSYALTFMYSLYIENARWQSKVIFENYIFLNQFLQAGR